MPPFLVDFLSTYSLCLPGAAVVQCRRRDDGRRSAEAGDKSSGLDTLPPRITLIMDNSGWCFRRRLEDCCRSY